MHKNEENKWSLKKFVHVLDFNKDTALRFFVFVSIMGLVFVAVTFFGQSFSNLGKNFALAMLAILVLGTWIMAGHAVVKSLFFVGASLSLVIYLAQTYCEVSAASRTVAGDQALKTLIIFSLVYIGFDFFCSLLKEIKDRSNTLKEINNGKKPWLILILLGLFAGFFVAEIYLVLSPIVGQLCVYR